VGTIDDYVQGKLKVGEKVAIIGAAYGAETSVSLAREGKDVTILEEAGRKVLGVTPYNPERGGRQTLLRQYIDETGVKFLSDVKVKEITGDSVVYIDKEGVIYQLTVDTVILALYRIPNRELIEALSERIKNLYDIGDCREPRNMRFATHEAAYVARQI
jgi:pyruvate/2-oxoglutarate dehydrogenase complex dihydrolipoamide dehydrogenase (E3) component